MVAAFTPLELNILRSYADGLSAGEIALRTRSTVPDLERDLKRLLGTPPDRMRARQLVREHDEAQRTPDQLTVEQLLARTRQHRVPALAKAADKASAAIEVLRAAYVEHEKSRAAREEIARLEKQLAEARAKLGDTPKATKTRGGTKAIRDWAAQNGYDVPVRGILRREIVDAYHAAQAAS